MTKTNVMRLLEAAGIPYRTAEYEYDESNLSGLLLARDGRASSKLWLNKQPQNAVMSHSMG